MAEPKVRVDFRLDEGAIDKLLAGRDGAVNRMMGGFAGLATTQVRKMSDQRVTHRTGEYRRGIHSRLVKPDEVEVEATAPHSLILEKGSRPHRIVARRAAALRFEVNGRVVYARSVNHPGTPAFNILRDGVVEAGKQLNRLSRR